MGSVCGKRLSVHHSVDRRRRHGGGGTAGGAGGGTMGVLFHQIDYDKKGYVTTNNLIKFMKEDVTKQKKTSFLFGPNQNEPERIMNKYGTNDQMNYEQFCTWWNSTYTTYNDDDTNQLVQWVQEVQDENCNIENNNNNNANNNNKIMCSIMKPPQQQMSIIMEKSDDDEMEKSFVSISRS